MAVRLQDKEDKTRRRTVRARQAWHYYRYYDLPGDASEFQNTLDLPQEGDPMPGFTDSPLGPFIARDGISWVKNPKGGNPQLELHCIKLRLETEA
jgi:hypothetical protein